jgi:PAS domain S-box-containing protein
LSDSPFAQAPLSESPRAWTGSPWSAETLRALLLGLIVFALDWGCLTLIRHTGRAAPLWPGNAIAIVWLLRSTPRSWAPAFVAAIAGNLAANLCAGDALATAAGLCLANSLEIAVAVGGLRRLVGGTVDLTQRRPLMIFAAVACCAAPLASAAFAMAWLHQPLQPENLLNAGTWFLADALGVAIIAPVLFTMTVADLRELWSPGQIRRNLLFLGLLLVVMTGVFGQTRAPLGVLVFPVLLLVTFRMEFLGAAIGLLVTAVTSLGFTLVGLGPAARAYASPTKQVIGLQIFLVITTFAILPVAASLARARQMKASLAASRDAAEAARAESIEAQRWAAMAQQIAAVGYFRLSNTPGASRWSDEIYRIHGVDPALGPLNATIEAIHPDDRALVEAALKAAREDATPFSDQYRVHRSDGAWRTVSCRTASEIGPDGRVTAVVGALVDITELKAVEAAAVESEARYRLLADKSSDVISRIDLQGRHIYVSPASAQMLGYTPEELVGRTAMDFVHPDDRALLHEVLGLVDRGCAEDVRPVLYRFRHKGGHWIWLDTHPTAVFDDEGRPLEFIAVSRDVTRAKQAEDDLRAAREAAEAATQAKSEFLANMSHEIRTPLTAIMGFSGLLKEVSVLPERARRHVDRISTAGQSLLAVVNDILDFSKLEAGQVDLDPQPFDPAEFIQETTQLLADQAANKGLDWRIEIEGELPAHVIADSGRLRQVLLNLLGNAIKFTAEGSVTVRTRYDADAGLKVSVTDTGPGVPAERRDRLFQRFSQVDGSVSRIHGGTGLGLAICKSLVELMGGQIGLVSEEGRGSTFWFTIAAPVTDAAIQAKGGEELCEPDGEARGARILIVDDLAVNRELVRAMLAPFGHDFEDAANGAEAVQAALRSGFDLILMDLQMPGMDGFEAARTIRAAAPLNKSTPIIALSANVLPAHIVASQAAGMDDHLGKPIALTALVAKVAQWAGEQHLPATGAKVQNA